MKWARRTIIARVHGRFLLSWLSFRASGISSITLPTYKIPRIIQILAFKVTKDSWILETFGPNGPLRCIKSLGNFFHMNETINKIPATFYILYHLFELKQHSNFLLTTRTKLTLSDLSTRKENSDPLVEWHKIWIRIRSPIVKLKSFLNSSGMCLRRRPTHLKMDKKSAHNLTAWTTQRWATHIPTENASNYQFSQRRSDG